MPAVLHWLGGEPSVNALSIHHLIEALLIAWSFYAVLCFYGLKAACIVLFMMAVSKSFLAMSETLLDTTFVLLFGFIALSNVVVMGKWVFLSTNGMPNFWLAQHPPEFDGLTYFTAI